jgi:hypothetical protein
MRISQRLKNLETKHGMGRKIEIIVFEDGDDLKYLERRWFEANNVPSNVTIKFVYMDARDAACA